MKLAFLIATLASSALAQSSTFSGQIRELPDFTPLAGVNVTLSQNDVVVASFFTSANGEFTFRDVKPGRYALNATKPGYTSPRRTEFDVPLPDSRPGILTMYAPGTISGRVEDEEGRPIEGMAVEIGNSNRILTDREGRFTSEPLVPGPYLEHIVPTTVRPGVLTSFTDADAAAVDYDYESSYWPGGATARERALPVAVAPGAALDIGVIRPRRIPLYRARVVPRNETCTDAFFIAVPTGDIQPVECAPEYLLTGIPAGRHRIRMSNEAGDIRYAMAEVEIGPNTRPIEMRFEPSITLTGRVVGAPGVKLPENLTVQVNLVHLMETGFSRSGRSNSEHYFALQNLAPGPVRINATAPAPFYLASTLYGGQPVRDGRITLAAGAELEFVLDNKAAVVTGTYEGDGGIPVAIVLWQPPIESRRMTLALDGRFTFRSVPPGEYRIAAIRSPMAAHLDAPSPQAGQAITLKPAETLNVTLKVQ